MAILFRMQAQYREWIIIILFVSFVEKYFTPLLSPFWIGWTVPKVQEGKNDITAKQLSIILMAALAGIIIGYNWSLIRPLEKIGWN